MVEQRQAIIRPLEEVFDPATIQECFKGRKGVIPFEISMNELIAIAESKGYACDGIYPFTQDPQNLRIFWIYQREDNLPELPFFTKPQPNGETVYILADEFERFKELFLGEE